MPDSHHPRLEQNSIKPDESSIPLYTLHYQDVVYSLQPTVFKILLVEDNPGDARLVREMLIEEGATQFNVRHVKHLSSAFEQLEKETFDIILLDLSLPDGQGLETLTRTHAVSPNIPIVVLTGLNDRAIAVQAVRQGAQDYLVKGEMDGKLLVRTMYYAIERNRLRIDLEQRTEELRTREGNFRNLIATNVDGMLVLDKHGVVQFVNPAAEALLGVKASELVGEVFGYSIVAGETREICIIGRRGEKPTAEMRVVETTWEGESAYLASLRDITYRVEAEAALREQKAFLSQVIDTNPNLIFVKDWDGKFILVNKAFANFYGTSVENIIGKKVADLNDDKQQLTQFNESDREVMTTLQPSCITEKVIDATGKERWFQTIKNPLISPSGKNCQLLVIATDITERKIAEAVLQKGNEELESRVEERTAELRQINQQLTREIERRLDAEIALIKSEESFRQLVEQAADAILLHDGEGRFIAVNQRACDSLGYSREELMNLTVSDIEENFVSEKVVEMWDEISPGVPVTINGVHKRKDGTTFPVEVRVGAFELDGRRLMIALARDVTERQRAEAEIRNALEKEKELSELKSRFITTASHEFRTPLTTILSSAELLEYFSHKMSQEKKLTYLHRIQQSVNHMTQLLNDVLIIAKSEAGKLEFKPAPLDLIQFCREIVEEMQLADGNQHEIVFVNKDSSKSQALETVNMDEKLLRHIFSNLLSNAIKYSPEGSAIRFEVACEDETAVFQVQDWGIGIPPEEQELLFDSFHRCKNVGNLPGTGLGLAIVKNAVELHGGSITVRSHLGAGTTFIVTLPLA